MLRTQYLPEPGARHFEPEPPPEVEGGEQCLPRKRQPMKLYRLQFDNNGRWQQSGDYSGFYNYRKALALMEQAVQTQMLYRIVDIHGTPVKESRAIILVQAEKAARAIQNRIVYNVRENAVVMRDAEDKRQLKVIERLITKYMGAK